MDINRLRAVVFRDVVSGGLCVCVCDKDFAVGKENENMSYLFILHK